VLIHHLISVAMVPLSMAAFFAAFQVTSAAETTVEIVGPAVVPSGATV
jgi:hypothetical protein